MRSLPPAAALAVILAIPCAMAPSAMAQERPGKSDETPARGQTAPGTRAGGDAVAATALMRDAKGRDLGAVTFREMSRGALIQVRLIGIPPGWHGFHIHEAGRCDPPDFKSAGGHWNPTKAGHGYMAQQGGHAGDLPNIFAAQDGAVMVDIHADGLRLGSGANGLGPSGSRALVIHAGPDDYATDPAGNSGDRIACGTIEAGSGEAIARR